MIFVGADKVRAHKNDDSRAGNEANSANSQVAAPSILSQSMIGDKCFMSFYHSESVIPFCH
jgi:hypothetical protein